MKSEFVHDRVRLDRKTRNIKIHDMDMIVYESIDCISDHIVDTNTFWEEELFERWKQYIPSEGLTFDIGGNIGNHCLMFKREFPDMEIYTFEIHPQHYNLLVENTKRYLDINTFNIGVSDCIDIVKFNDGGNDNTGATHIQHIGGNNRNITLPLDMFIFKRKIDFIKIDIEGHELYALKGMKKNIERDKPLIWIEDMSEESVAVNFLKEMGYNLIDYNQKTWDYLLKYEKL